jgi:hypothetical protein
MPLDDRRVAIRTSSSGGSMSASRPPGEPGCVAGRRCPRSREACGPRSARSACGWTTTGCSGVLRVDARLDLAPPLGEATLRSFRTSRTGSRSVPSPPGSGGAGPQGRSGPGPRARDRATSAGSTSSCSRSRTSRRRAGPRRSLPVPRSWRVHLRPDYLATCRTTVHSERRAAGSMSRIAHFDAAASMYASSLKPCRAIGGTRASQAGHACDDHVRPSAVARCPTIRA